MILEENDYQQIEIWKNVALAGQKAKEFKESESYKWFKLTILDSIKEKAINTLRIAKSEEERMLAQQMFIASEEPIDVLEQLISQSDGAIAQLAELSKLEVEERENKALPQGG